MKYAVDRSLAGKKYETADVGESLARVMRYWTVRGKLEGVHPDHKVGRELQLLATRNILPRR